ncbi:uncharacterized protein EI90DRAFT_2282360 [Cantharellus anzutake]|uniref:uncharacterized protein n=1 Tax=Cantharellus anzutake TaxID=1750568 RepID=UPI001906ACCF|nr:uncharacterized protein EI90DRAFT_2282360 [Cantharellus anzutake]KAF8339774.1 hypothetical protein EI90DRAFT_2282360 [Cantharellus anzutake]
MLKNESTYENASHQIPIHHSSSPPVIDTYTFPHRQDPDVGAPPFGSAALQRQWGEAFTSPQQQKTIPSASIFPGHTGAPVTSGIGGIGSGGDGGGNGGTDDDNDGFGTEWGSSGESGGEGDDEKSGRGEGIGSGLMLPQSPGKTSQPILLPTPRFSNRGTPAPLFPNGPPSRRAGSVRPNAVVPPFHTVIPPYSAKPVSPPYLSWILPTQQNYQADPFRVILSPASDAVSRDTVWNSPKDKWTKAKAETQTLYDTERKPQMLNSLRTALHVNPMLCCSDGKGYPLIVDLSNSEKDIRSIVDPEVRWRDDDVLNQPVTLPRVTRLRLISPKMSEPIEIVNRESVTVKDAFRSMFSYFKQPITWKELESFPDKVKKELEKAYFINAAKWTGNPTKVPKVLRRVDMLGNEPIFDGLHCDRDLVMEVTGELDVATLIMDFKSRIFMEW